ncbi:MAG: hypothetical protein A4E69_00056 [Syntrophus sp. PtaB.Bin138]|nr:MAG: hypothetical protein A4E69_00056 [Syntrophus sp. PtaB.Bin138]
MDFPIQGAVQEFAGISTLMSTLTLRGSLLTKKGGGLKE